MSAATDIFGSVRGFLDQQWRPISRSAVWVWAAFYALFMVYAATNSTGFLFVDSANLIVHESGHLLFGWFGPGLGLWGGTLMELLVPLCLALYFAVQRQIAG